MSQLLTHLSVIGGFFIFIIAVKEGVHLIKKEKNEKFPPFKASIIPNPNRAIELFFMKYGNAVNNSLRDGLPGVDNISQAFADCYVEVNNQEIKCSVEQDKSIGQLGGGLNIYRRTGAQSLDIESIVITPLTENNALVKLQWKGHSYTKDETTFSFEFHTYYFVNCKNEEIKIFARLVEGQEDKVKWISSGAYQEQGMRG